MQAIIDDLWEWGARSRREVEHVYGSLAASEAVKKDLIMTRRVGQIYVYILTGKRLSDYGITQRYRYVPARTTLIATILLRAGIERALKAGWTDPKRFTDYSAARHNMAILRKDSKVLIIVGRFSISRRTVYHFIEHFNLEDSVKPDEYRIYVHERLDYEVEKVRLLNTMNMNIENMSLLQAKSESLEIYSSDGLD